MQIRLSYLGSLGSVCDRFALAFILNSQLISNQSWHILLWKLQRIGEQYICCELDAQGTVEEDKNRHELNETKLEEKTQSSVLLRQTRLSAGCKANVNNNRGTYVKYNLSCCVHNIVKCK